MNDIDLTKRMGFRSRKKTAMTNAERQQKFRRTQGSRQTNITLTIEVAAALKYIRAEWGMTSNKEATQAAIRFLALCTRQGLQRLPQSIDD